MKLHSECGITEEQIVDLLCADGGASAELGALRRHAETCADCAARLGEWQRLLGGMGQSEKPSPSVRSKLLAAVRWRAPLRRAATSAMQWRMLLLQASKCAKRRAPWHRSQWQQRSEWPQRLEPSATWQAESQRPRRRNRIVAIGSAVALAAMLYAGALGAIRERLGNTSLAESSTLAQVAADNEIMSHMGMVVQTRTAQYPVQGRGPELAHGVAWVNDESEEMLLLVEGLPSLPGQDYRVWSVHQNSRTDLGALQLAAGKAHLHYHGSELHGAEAISVSREPLGGGANGTGAQAVEVASVKLK